MNFISCSNFKVVPIITIFVLFRGNFNSGAYISQSNNTLIQNSTFEGNSAFSRYVEESKLTINFITSGGLTLFFVNGSNSYSEINSCTFRDNHAGVNVTNREDAEGRPQLYIPRGHGGGLLISFQTTIGHRVVIRNCTFTGNSAELTGGAVSIQFYRGSADSDVTSTNSPSSVNNTVEIEGTTFEENFSSGEGGAVCVNTFEAANYNTVLIKGSVFHNNSAEMSGGALSFNIQVQLLLKPTVDITTRASFF